MSNIDEGAGRLVRSTAPVLQANDLWRSYTRGSETIHALAGVSLTVESG
jgi:hypothetical protein